MEIESLGKRVCGIYKITSPSGKIYIGQSRCLKDRWVRYRKHHCKSQPKLYNSFMKYGFNNHTFEIIERCIFEELNLRERFWQDHYDVLGENGLNLVLVDSEDKPCVYSDDVKKKMSLAKAGMYFGEDNPFFGKTHTEETRKKSSIAIKEYYKKNGIPNLGRKASEETKRKMRAHMLGKYAGKKNPMYGVPSPMTGKNHTEETKKRMSESMTGKYLGRLHTEGAKKKMSLQREGEGNVKAALCLDTYTGIFYGCIKDAAIAYNIKIKKLQYHLGVTNTYKQFLRL